MAFIENGNRVISVFDVEIAIEAVVTEDRIEARINANEEPVTVLDIELPAGTVLRTMSPDDFEYFVNDARENMMGELMINGKIPELPGIEYHHDADYIVVDFNGNCSVDKAFDTIDDAIDYADKSWHDLTFKEQSVYLDRNNGAFLAVFYKNDTDYSNPVYSAVHEIRYRTIPEDCY